MKKLTGIGLFILWVFLVAGCLNVSEESAQAGDDVYSNDESTNTGNSQSETSEESAEAEKLLVWTYTDVFLNEVKSFEEKYKAEVTVELQQIDGLLPMVTGVIKSQQDMPDVVVFDLESMEADSLGELFLDLTDMALSNNADATMIPYVYQLGLSEGNELLGLSYQATPTGLFYRRSLAVDVFGSDDPLIVGEYFADYNGMKEAAALLGEKDIKLFSDLYTLRYFDQLHKPFFDEEGSFVVGEDIRDYLELVKQIQLEEQAGL